MIDRNKTKNQGKKGVEKMTKLFKKENGITLIALIITIVLNCSYLAMERMLKQETILQIM